MQKGENLKVKVKGTGRKVEVERKYPIGIRLTEGLEEATYGMSVGVVEIWQEKN